MSKTEQAPEAHSWMYGSQSVVCAVCGIRQSDASPDDDCSLAWKDYLSQLPKPGYMGNINPVGCDPDCP